jgi:hypothetical protein
VVKRENANLSEMSPRHPSTRNGRDDRGSSADGHNAKTA